MGKSGKNKGINILTKIFLITMGISLGICTMGIGTVVMTYNSFIHQTQEAFVEGNARRENIDIEKVERKDVENNQDKEKLLETDTSINKTMAIFGTDMEGLRTDVILVANFNSENNQVNMISVPRDTKVEWTESQKSLLPSKHSWVETSKINEMTAWGGMDQIRGLTVRELENILGIKIDNYMIISLNAFREIIDAIDGVEFDVPQRMKKDDYSQNLHIDLYPGIQILDGDKAEQLVRYRDYVDGDLGRIKVQQSFLEAVANKVLSPEIITKIPALIPVMLKSVKTDVSLIELPTYYPYIKSFNINNLSFYTLPGIDNYQNNISYYFTNIEEIEKLVNELFFYELYK